MPVRERPMTMRPRSNKGNLSGESNTNTYFIILVAILCPLVIVVTACLRYAYFLTTAHEAAAAACKCRTFRSDVLPDLSAVTTAQTKVRQQLGHYGGLTLSSCDVYLVQQSIANGQSVKSTVPLRVPPDPEHNLYQVEVSIHGTIDPFLSAPLAIPCVTTPVHITASANRAMQYLEALTQ